MFVYENGNSLNLTFKGSLPVENPEIVIKGYEDGATLTVDGTVYGTGSKEFEGKAKTLVFQKDGKLMITFKGIDGMSDPEVILDESKKGVVNAVVCGTDVTVKYDNNGATVDSSSSDASEMEPEQDKTPEELPEEDNSAEELPDEIEDVEEE